MIATPRFVFLHLHKSGGTFVNESLLRFVPGARQLGYHLPHTSIPAPLAHLPVLGLVRSPWSYYVSWFAFQSSLPQPNALFRVLSNDGRLDFGGTLRNMLDLGRRADLLDAAVRALPAQYTNRGLNLPGFALAPIAGTSRGLYSYLYSYVFGAPTRTGIGRMEHLREELPGIIMATGEQISSAFRTHLANAAPTNVSSHGVYTDYYDPGLANLVLERDRPIIERFGYRYGD